MLPKNLKYGSKVESSLARSTKTNISPQNGTGNYSAGDTITINIPTRNNLVLAPTESYLKFNVKFRNGATANNAYKWDSCGAHGIISKLTIWHGSNMIQQIDQYGMLAKLMMDLQAPTDATYGKLNCMSGTRSDLVAIGSSAAPAANDKYQVIQVNTGDRVDGNAFAAVTAANTDVIVTGTITERTYCLNLISLLGSLCGNNYIPLFALQSSPLRLDITLVSDIHQCVASAVAGGTFTISNCEYVAQFIELSDSAMGMINDSINGQDLQFVFPDFRNFQYVGPTLSTTAAAQINIPIAAKVSSLKALFTSQRDKGVGASTFYPYSSVTLGLKSYFYRIGPMVVPSKAPDSYEEHFAEVCKAIASVGDYNHQPSIDRNSYQLATSNAYSAETASYLLNSNSSGSYYIGIDLENYPNANKSEIFSGINTNTDDIFLVVNYTTPAANVAPRFDTFANFDSVFVARNGTAFVQF